MRSAALPDGVISVELSLVIPAYNERKRLPRSLPAIREYAQRAGRRLEVIVVDDGSSDGTAELIREVANEWPAVRLVSLRRNSGKGAAVRTGFARSSGEIVAFCDADLSAPIDQLDGLIEDLGDADVALLSRGLPGARLERRQSVLRETLGKLYSVVARLVLLRGVPDAHCGLKAYRGGIGRVVFREVVENGILFDIEALVILALRGGRISQRPAVWSHDPGSRIRLGLSSAWAVVVGLARIKLRHRVLWPIRAHGPIKPDVWR